MSGFSWNFGDSVNLARRAVLDAAPSFEVIAREICASMEVLCRHFESSVEVSGFQRYVCCIRVESDLFDLFFNSKNGYRAAYFRSPYEGLQVNENLITGLMDRILDHDWPEMSLDRRYAAESLVSPSAKVWLAEPQVGLCDRCCGEWTEPLNDRADIINGRWELAMGSNAIRGRKAPRLQKVRIIGAFVNSSSDELVPARKRKRAMDIFQSGWA